MQIDITTFDFDSTKLNTLYGKITAIPLQFFSALTCYTGHAVYLPSKYNRMYDVRTADVEPHPQRVKGRTYGTKGQGPVVQKGQGGGTEPTGLKEGG